MDIRFDDKVVLVTGASSGIGKATAIEFAKSGADVAVHYHNNKQGAEEAVAEIRKAGRRAITVGGDLSQKSEVDRVFKTVFNEFGRIDILVNNAGALIKRTPIGDVDEELWDRVMDVNLKSLFMCCQAVIPHMKERGKGQIVNVTSIAARTGGGNGSVHYATTKGGVSTFTKGLAKELAGTGIYVNAIAPGVIATPFHDRFSPPELRKKFAEATPLKREGTSEEIAYGILFIASDYASYIYGETLEINGGMLMD